MMKRPPLSKFWAIKPESFEDWEDLEQLSKPVMSEKKGSIAFVDIFGPLVERNYEGDSCAYCSYEWIQCEIEKYLLDNSVKEIRLVIDSPGGEVLGLDKLASFIYNSRSKKPIIAHVSSMAASAAYWLASACSKILMTSSTAMVGSIGVVNIHIDCTEQHKMAGIKITELSTGKYKRALSENNSLTDETRLYLQNNLQQFFTIFVESVAKFRGMDVSEVLKLADGREYIGQTAVKNGLVDGVQNSVIGDINMDYQKLYEELLQKYEELLKRMQEKEKQEAPVEPEEPKEDVVQEQEEPKKEAVQDIVPEEKQKESAMSSAVKKAIAEERSRLAELDSIDELISDAQAKEVVRKARQNGQSAKDVAYAILVKSTSNRNPLRPFLAESKKIRTLGVQNGSDLSQVGEKAAEKEAIANLVMGMSK